MVNRDYIINRLKSRSTTVDEFNFNKLQAPPILSIMTPTDVGDLYTIAHSIRYSAKPDLKYKMIDEIMRRRGFRKLSAGTNRLCYAFLEDNSFVAKIAYDDIGRGDNPAEFRNQFFLKPFVTKIFEVTPCGTLAFAERVNPITNREEFITVADDVYTLISEFLIGEYVLADIGSHFFMNYGIRNGFGVVLLDYPYVYPIDGKKLYCNVPDPTSQSGCCDGEIDYDDGFNFLVCKKCGVKYRAQELALKIEETGDIIIKEKGGFKMKVRVSGGDLNKETVAETGVEESRVKVTVTTGKPFKKGPKPTKFNDKAVNGVNENHEKKQPVPVERPVPVNTIQGFDEMKKKYEDLKAKYDDLQKMYDEKADECDDQMQLINNLQADAENKSAEPTINNPWTALSRLVDLIGDMDAQSKFELLTCNDAVALHKMYSPYASVVDDEGLVRIQLQFGLKDNSGEEVMIQDMFELARIVPSAYEDVTEITHFFTDDEYQKNVDDKIEALVDQLEDLKAKVEDNDPEEDEVVDQVEDTSDEPAYNDSPIYLHGVTKNIKDIFPKFDHKTVMLLEDESGEFVTGGNNSLIVIDKVDNRSLDDITFVSTAWYENVSEALANEDQKNYEENEAAEEAEEQVEDDGSVEMPVGAMPAVGVNGVE